MPVEINEGFELPPGKTGWTDFKWFHARSDYPTRLTILSDKPISFTGHYYKTRMHPCKGEKCSFCAVGIGTQVRYVFGVVEWETRSVGLYEMSRNHALDVQSWIARFGSVRGMTIEVQRAGRSKHCRIEMSYIEDPAPVFFGIMESPDVKLALQNSFQRADSSFLQDSLPDSDAGKSKKITSVSSSLERSHPSVAPALNSAPAAVPERTAPPSGMFPRKGLVK